MSLKPEAGQPDVGPGEDDGYGPSPSSGDAATTAQPPFWRRMGGGNGVRDRLHEIALVPALIAAIIVGSFVNSAFLTSSNIIYSILQQSAVLAVVVLAEAMILIAGKFDLSLESVVALAPAFGVWLMVPADLGGSGAEINPYLGMFVILVLGAAVGLLNGFFVVKLRLNAFIVTLAMLILLRGLTLGLTGGQTFAGLPEPVTYLGTGTFLDVPVSVWVAGILYLAVGLFLRFHALGRSIYAVGGNSQAARAAGIRVELTVWVLYVAGGVLAGLAGLMLTGQILSVSPNQGENLIFSVFAAAVIGGIGLNGGVGTMFGALTGVLLLGTIANILTLSRVDSFWIDASYGGIILFALVLSRFATGAEEESRG